MKTEDLGIYIIKEEDIDIERFVKEGFFFELYLKGYFHSIRNLDVFEHIELTMNHYFKKYILSKISFKDLEDKSKENFKGLKKLEKLDRLNSLITIKSDSVFELLNKEHIYEVYECECFLVYFDYNSIKKNIWNYIVKGITPKYY